MGSCFSCCEEKNIVKVALKFPGGTEGIIYSENSRRFEPCNIDDWIQSLYSLEWTGYMVYNDETSHISEDKRHTKGHCKGIVAWNDKKVSWFIHSVPNFPKIFDGKNISLIEPGERIYGQSFIYLEMQYKKNSLIVEEIIDRIFFMDAHVYLSKNVMSNKVKNKEKTFRFLDFSENLRHISKPQTCHQDIYDELSRTCGEKWTVESWKRGHVIKQIKHENEIKEIEKLKYQSKEWKESQDHSKWAVSESYVFIGDLNRMISQWKRGGGGLVIQNPDMAKAFRELIVS